LRAHLLPGAPSAGLHHLLEATQVVVELLVRLLAGERLLLLHDLPVQHLLPGRVTPHLPTEGARRVDDVLVCDGSGPILTATTCI